MRRIHTAPIKWFKTARRVKSFRIASAVLMMFSLMLPIALPLPAYAYSRRLPSHSEPPFALTSADTSFSGWVSELVSKLTSGPTGFVAPTRKRNMNSESVSATAELEKRVAGLSSEVKDGSKFEVGQVISLAVFPVDKKGETVNGIGTKWTVADPDVVRIINDSEAIATGKGETRLTATVGGKKFEIRLSVSGESAGSSNAAFFDDPIEVAIIDDAKADSMISPENNLGSPVGQGEMSSPSRSAAVATVEQMGSSNFSFGIPVASLSGRGIDASVGITYNSRVWSRFGLEGSRAFSFNPNQNWLSPGFEIGFGDLVPYGNSGVSGYLLTGPDGSRHQLALKSTASNCHTFESNDGTFIQAKRCGTNTTTPLTVKYTDGTQVLYGTTTGGGKKFPVRITDRNGNYIN
ncbi:MAG: hypothetical protein ACRD6X_13285, partial [Pyrinomonadaceae bacterium]